MSEGAQFTRVHGGIINDQMLKGHLRFFTMQKVGLFANTISDGSVYILGDMPKFGGVADKVPDGKPVPRSAAELAFQIISSRCTVSQIILINDDEIQFVTENNSFAWQDDVEMTTEVAALGNRYVPGTVDGNGVLVDFSTIIITEFPTFKLA